MEQNPCPLFEGIQDHELTSLLGCLHHYVRSYDKGTFILLDQDHVQHVGLVRRGTVHMLKEDLWGNQTLLGYMGPGELFGETFALSKESKSYVSFMAATDVEVQFMTLQNILHPCPRQCPFHSLLVQNMFHLIGEKNVRLMERIEVASKSSLREKILAYLSLQAQRQDSRYITLPLSRSEMASYLQANRSAMIRELSAMKSEGLIDFHGNTFVLK